MAMKILGLVLLCLLSLSLMAEELELNPAHPDRYVVKKGDTLWDIAALFLRKPWLWPEIWQRNPQIKDPHWIYPGDVLTLRFRAGRPVLELSRGGRGLKLSPTIREHGHDKAIPPIPLDAIWPFLSESRVVGPEEMINAPYILGSDDERLVHGTGDRLYVRGLQDTGVDRYRVFRCGMAYRNPPANYADLYYADLRYGMQPINGYAYTCIPREGEEVLGYEAIHVGEARVEQFGDPAAIVITQANREVQAGDRLLAQADLEFPEFIPHAPAKPVAGRIISVMDALSQVGPYQVVALNLGRQVGLEPGHVLAVYQSGVIVPDRDAIGRRVNVELPPERIGELMVFRAFAMVSYALVMRASRPVHIYDLVQNP